MKGNMNPVGNPVILSSSEQVAEDCEPSEFEKFEDLARRLLNTPKPKATDDES